MFSFSYVSTPFFFPFGFLLHFSRLSLIKYFTWNSISHCMGIPSDLPKGPLMGPYRDLGRIPINGELNIIWGILIICYHARIQYLITSAAVSLPLMQRTFVDSSWQKLAKIYLLHPNISMCFLHNVLYTFSKVLRRRICLTIKNFLSWWSFPPFLQP